MCRIVTVSWSRDQLEDNYECVDRFEVGVENLEEHQQVQELEDVTDSGVGFGNKLLLFMIVFPTHEKERVEETKKHEQVVAEKIQLLIIGVNITELLLLQFFVGFRIL